LTTAVRGFYNERMLPEQDRPPEASLLVAGATAIAVGVLVAVIGTVAAPEAAPIAHVSVFVGMVLSVAGILAGPHARRADERVSMEVRSDAHR
jgi:uncharacterized membrane protein HdeD (DUF308 family)